MTNIKTIFVTGGAGYIGSHCVLSLLEAGYDVVAIDNFANSVEHKDSAASLDRVSQITGKKIVFYKCSLLNIEQLDNIFKKHQIDCVIHFAAMKSVGESMKQPLMYYKNNLVGAMNLLEVMATHKCFHLVFSSSCTVYGNPKFLPITEVHPTGNVTNVYGRTKLFIEEILKDCTSSNSCWNIISLRYFNPVGAHPSGLIGENPTKNFSNLMPYLAQVALGKKPTLSIFGDDYNTPDGTGIRDYVHIMDLADGHVAALKKLLSQHSNLEVYNLGSGQGTSVLELIKTFERVTGVKIPYTIEPRRQGDIASMYANCDLAKTKLGWSTKYTLEDACKDFWRWQSMNPNGYEEINTIKINSDNRFSSNQIIKTNL
ncbi:UDP-glucose 4-epimerase-like [Daktulosphaira vitifoliae]|uniref:UDP-glucose 4-epimerase-like n=1 Tax=Daktulosphaira vitifoliae TaxID=58002 RepID=UPI0021A9D75C|nr:UDP-glucose 4-epimerase-like [Daktulosphaira vitifoliae]